MRPLAPRQEAILGYLLDLYEHEARGYPATPAQIAIGIGMGKLPRVEGNGRVFNAAQRIISALTGLRQRGLIANGRRPDGLSGSSYALTYQGFEVAEELRQATQHRIQFSRYQRGRSVPFNRPTYGYTLRCSCGWERRVNDTKREAQQVAKDHDPNYTEGWKMADYQAARDRWRARR